MNTEKRKPGFFIVGAAKAGTTSLYNYLKQNKQVYVSPVKEPNYFCTDIKTEEFNDTFQKIAYIDYRKYFSELPLKPLQVAFVREPDQYNMLFNNVTGEKIAGECSTSYLFSTDAAKNIFSFNKDAKIIIVLRDPVERAFSHYLMALRFGFTHLPFREALDKDISKTDKGWGKSELFIELGLYYEQVKRYLDVFPAEHVKIFLFDDLKRTPEKVIEECFTFLQVDNIELPGLEKHNEALVPRNPKINNILARTGIKRVIINALPEKLKGNLKSLLFNTRFPELSVDDKEFLKEIYKSDIEKTAGLINRDLSGWID